MRADPHHRISLMPVIIFAAFSLMAWLPLVTSIHVQAAMPQRVTVVKVQPGDSVWSIASHTAASGVDVNELADRIITANHLVNASLSPGDELRIPQ
jgi:predicted Zn-dependent protease